MSDTIRPGWSQHVDVWWMDCNTGIRVAPNHVNGKFNWQVPLGDGRFMNGTGWKTIGEAMQVAEAMAKMYGVIVDEPAKTCAEVRE